MSTEQAFRDHEMRLVNPPGYEGYPSEPCDRCHRDLDDDYATRVRDPRYPGHWSYYCSDCADRIERCDQCGFLRCIMRVAVHHIRIELAPEWEIWDAGLGYELRYCDPVAHEWHVFYEAPEIKHCERAYELIQEGWSVLPDWEELDDGAA